MASKNYALIFWVDGITNMLAGLLLLMVLPKKPKSSTTISRDSGLPSPPSTSAYKDKIYLLFIVMVILFAFGFFQIFTILPLYLTTQLGLSEGKYGILMTINGLLIALLEMVLVFKLEKSLNSLRFIAVGTFLMGISYAMYNVIPGAFLVAFISTLTITFGEMLSMPFMNTFWISRSSDNNRGQYAALYTMGWGIAQITGPFTGGWIANHYGFASLWWTILAIMTIASVGFYKLTDKKYFAS